VTPGYGVTPCDPKKREAPAPPGPTKEAREGFYASFCSSSSMICSASRRASSSKHRFSIAASFARASASSSRRILGCQVHPFYLLSLGKVEERPPATEAPDNCQGGPAGRLTPLLGLDEIASLIGQLGMNFQHVSLICLRQPLIKGFAGGAAYRPPV